MDFKLDIGIARVVEVAVAPRQFHYAAFAEIYSNSTSKVTDIICITLTRGQSFIDCSFTHPNASFIYSRRKPE